MEQTDKRRGGSGAKLDARFRPGVGPPNAISRVWEPLAAIVRTFRSWGKRRFMAGKTADRPWAEGFVTGSTAVPRRATASGQLASSAYGRSAISPPMNRRNPRRDGWSDATGHAVGQGAAIAPLNRLFYSRAEACAAIPLAERNEKAKEKSQRQDRRQERSSFSASFVFCGSIRLRNK